MRLTHIQQQSLIQNFMQLFAFVNTELWLFGSRADDTKRGGDIDLLIKCYQLDYAKLSCLINMYKSKLQKQIGPKKLI